MNIHSENGMTSMNQSFCPRADKHSWNSPKQDFEVQPKRPVVDVFQIQSHPVFEITDFVATADLPQASEAGFDAETAAV